MHRTQITISSNLLDYKRNTKAPTANLTTIKLLLNSVLSTPKAKFLTIDIKNFYLETMLKDKQYMFLPKLEEIMNTYNLYDKVYNSKVYMRIN